MSMGYETVGRAHNIGLQHVNMSPQQGAHHFTLFLDVLCVILSVSELSWSDFIKKKGMILRRRIHNFFDFLAMTERIDITIGGYIEGKLCMYF